ncbi:hypothetical protein CPB85DRAFT_1249382 [Mucidula mucida]|nr:hypothetical protein CPB85DRAFT_1249382 [Mucidula mucida]
MSPSLVLVLYLTLISLAVAFSVLAGVRFYSRQVNIPVGDQVQTFAGVRLEYASANATNQEITWAATEGIENNEDRLDICARSAGFRNAYSIGVEAFQETS